MNSDPYAEAVIAGCCAASREACALAHIRVTADQFTSPVLAAVFTAAEAAPKFPMPTQAQATTWALDHAAGRNPPTIWPSELRLQHIANATGVTITDLERLVAARPVADDITGLYAGRITAAADRRHLESNVVELHELLRVGDQTRAHELAARIAEQTGAA
jgi:hypothetical protein